MYPNRVRRAQALILQEPYRLQMHLVRLPLRPDQLESNRDSFRRSVAAETPPYLFVFG